MYGTLLDHVGELAHWSEQQRAVMQILCGRGAAFKVAADELEISRSRVKQLHFKALRKMMRSLSALEADQLTNNMLTISDVSNMLNVHINTIRRWTNEGKLKCTHIGPRRDRRFWRRDVSEFLRKEGGEKRNG